ncbi:MAG TPA: formylglycine-generating enzyme family protein [Thermoanaerobaculia bacterium]|nr:formylglycine-generating enzyme family protein [Thermoanaerobaculia bacterium]
MRLESLFQWLETPQGRTEVWREIPPGRFLMGSLDDEGQEDERPLRETAIERGFRIGAGPVTNAQYAAFDPDHHVEAWEGVPREELAHHPVCTVTWYEASAFCGWLSQAVDFAGAAARLPSEEEWEYACRAGTGTPYWSGREEKDLDRVGWYRGNSGKRTHRAGEKPANAWGLFDVHGNVREWTASLYRNEPGKEIARDSMLVLRGGGFWDEAPFTRSAIRCVRYPVVHYRTVGFRVVLDAR